ncbi:hypothetical protein SAMN05421821_10747 [Mucilaginibacter lappiensis]|uniref:Uncharacterized protein n=1 Tax=Mucilaginibacter lappiensis TaxID=354630 RepID=A0ABR6PLP1_9SPHI|nr:DUF6624 domain-containing protein [Mucilaginibacter lappiensis]MBB6110526.1 hypothetical protein [Mucilaginibacter lappiensis]SIR40234.1 hypothetical protein SAMN05421821_10747 [Mucilaginibacter lappiensis]
MRILLAKTLLIIALLCGYFAITPPAQVVKKNTALIKQIDSMFKTDQFWRVEFTKRYRKEKSAYSDETIQNKWEEADRINELKAKAIIKKYGYPGYDLVGSSSDSFWAIIQHCDDDIPFQERALALMKQQMVKNNASKRNYAYLIDRVLVNKDQKQIYGTQLSRDNKTGKFSPFPLKDPKSVDKLRKEVGLEPLAVYIKNFQ